MDGGFTDAEASSDLDLGEPLEEPPADKLFLGFVELAWTARPGLVRQAAEAILLEVSFPASLGSNGVAEGTSQILLGSQFTLPKHDTDIAEVWQVVEGDSIDRVVSAEDNAVAVVINKPQAWGDKSAGVGRRGRGQRQHRIRA